MPRHTLLSLVALLLVSLPGLAAQERPGHTLRPPSTVLVLAQNQDIGARRAAAVARKATGGRVLTIKRTQSKRPNSANGAYKVKVLLKGGRMRTLKVDAENGRLRK